MIIRQEPVLVLMPLDFIEQFTAQYKLHWLGKTLIHKSIPQSFREGFPPLGCIEFDFFYSPLRPTFKELPISMLWIVWESTQPPQQCDVSR